MDLLKKAEKKIQLLDETNDHAKLDYALSLIPDKIYNRECSDARLNEWISENVDILNEIISL